MDFGKSLFCFVSLSFFTDIVISEHVKTLETLWNLTEYAIQSRQRFSGYPNQQFNFQNHADDNNHINRFQGIRYGGNIPIYAGHYNNFQKFQYSYPPNGPIPLNQNPHAYYPPFIQNQNGYGPRPQHNYPNPQNGGFLSSILPSRDSFMGALESIARNDELRCVPRILCEVTSGTLSARQSGLKLPFNVNMDSIVGLLSGFNGIEINPILSFGKAALLGYSSKGNAGTCMYAYPECPRDPERLVEYLNNYNGGFFRFFNGLNPQHLNKQPYGLAPEQNFGRPPYLHSFQPGINTNIPYRFYNNQKAEKRILTRPAEYDSNRYSNFRQQKGIKFPNDIDISNELYPNNFYNYDSSSILKFPIRDEEDRERPLRQPKRLPGSHDGYETNYQRPSPDHRPTPMIFPDRTGTGELKFTPQELSDRPSAFQNNLISSDIDTNNDPFYFSNFEANSPGTYKSHFFPS